MMQNEWQIRVWITNESKNRRNVTRTARCYKSVL